MHHAQRKVNTIPMMTSDDAVNLVYISKQNDLNNELGSFTLMCV